ncbi:MAG TPA: hypothetical protein VOA41_09560 [Candidatus Dormibacteraeota bacterium]|nr:hypothetical protein [Candidatus Dormibacteraeota bacterium]
MAHTFLIFDYGANEQEAQEARHKLEGWKQAFRLDKKLLVKFERSDPDQQEAANGTEPVGGRDGGDVKEIAVSPKAKAKSTKTKTKSSSESKPQQADRTGESAGHIRLLVRLDFSDHEKLSYQRWLDRVPADDHFKNASPKIVRPGEAEFTKTAELFDVLD